VVTATALGSYAIETFISGKAGAPDAKLMQVFVVFIIAVVFALGMASFFLQHFYFVLKNITTLETFEKRRIRTRMEVSETHRDDVANNSNENQRQRQTTTRSADRLTAPSDWTTDNPFDVGWKKNFQQVFGPNPWLWFLPVANGVGDGVTFPLNRNFARDETDGLLSV